MLIVVNDNKGALKKWLMFIPLLSFVIMVDIEIIIQTIKYRSFCFKSEPRHAKSALIVFGITSLLLTIVCLGLSLLTFGFQRIAIPVKNWFYIFLGLKCLFWSPFVAFEYFDIFFEHLYTDVQFQLNDIDPDNNNHRTNSN